jgi:hypothetical protein
MSPDQEIPREGDPDVAGELMWLSPVADAASRLFGAMAVMAPLVALAMLIEDLAVVALVVLALGVVFLAIEVAIVARGIPFSEALRAVFRRHGLLGRRGWLRGFGGPKG